MSPRQAVQDDGTGTDERQGGAQGGSSMQEGRMTAQGGATGGNEGRTASPGQPAKGQDASTPPWGRDTGSSGGASSSPTGAGCTGVLVFIVFVAAILTLLGLTVLPALG